MCANCNKQCEGEKVSSTCIVWEGKRYEFTSFNALIEYLVEIVKTYMEVPNVDLKTLSNKDLTRDEILQLLVDKSLQLQVPTTTGTPQCPALDISSINSCSVCNQSFCEKLQLMVDKIALLEAEVQQLKQTIYN